MSDLHKALGDIENIRKQMAQTTEFRGYGPATLATTAAFALIAAGVQAKVAPNPANDISKYLTVWIVTAALAATLTGFQMYTRARRMHS